MFLKEFNNVKVCLIWNDNNEIGLGFIGLESKTLTYVRSIKKTFIKYEGLHKVSIELENEIINTECEFVKFEKMPRKILESILLEIEDRFEKYNEPLEESLEFILNLFSDHKLKEKCEKDLIGDIGELIFMIKCKEHGINVENNIRILDDSLYDFYFGDFAVEIKTSTKRTNEIKITHRQLQEYSNKKIIVIVFQKMENMSNIFDLFNILDSSNIQIVSKKNQYLELANDDIYQKVINSYTVNLENVQCFILDDNLLPEINIVKNGGLKEIELVIDVSSSIKNDLELLKKHIN